MPTFTTIDFETALGYRWSICQVGLVRVENGTIKDTFTQLVQPPENEYWNRFTDIHKIDASKTFHSPSFDKVWPLIQRYIKGQAVVAHNIAFDASCLDQTLSYYSIELPSFQRHCTYQIYRDNLKSLCNSFKIKLNHHGIIRCSRLR